MDPAETHRSRGREHVPIHHPAIRREAVPSRLSRCFTGPELVISKSYSLIGVPLMPTPNLPSGFDFTDPDIHADRLPVEELAELRRTAPIWWNEQPGGGGRIGRRRLRGGAKHQGGKGDSARREGLPNPENTALPRYKEG